MIYFDNAATTKPIDIAIKRFIEVSNSYFANPSSLHSEGKKSRQIIEKSEDELKNIIDAKIGKVIFTASATLSNNIAISGIVEYLKGKIKNRKVKILYNESDHPSIVDTMKAQKDVELKRIRFDKLYKKVNENILNESIENENKEIEDYILSIYFEAIKEFEPDFLVLQWVNNENGLILPVEKIANFAKKVKDNIAIHIDAVQGFLKLPFFNITDIDTISFSSHKFGGLKGSSIFYIKDLSKIKPIIFGGGQMENLFPSTENVAAIAATAATSNFLYSKIEKNYEENLSKKIYLFNLIANNEILSKNLFIFSDKVFLSEKKPNKILKSFFSPYIIKIYNRKIPSQVLQNILNDEKIMVSIGSACSSNKKKMMKDKEFYGIPETLSDKGIRVSFFIEETKEQIDIFIDKLNKIIEKYANW
jgi:cysteine desulfurase